MPIASQWRVEIPHISLPSLLLNSAAHPLPDVPIFIDAKNPKTNYLTLKSYRLWSQRLAVGLRHAGLRDGDRVFLFSDNNTFSPVVFMGVIMAGGIFTGASSSAVDRELAYQLKDSDALFLLCTVAHLRTGLEAARQVSLPRTRVFVFDDHPAMEASNPLHFELRHWSSLIGPEDEGRAFQWEQLSTPEGCRRTITLNYSSGTTGLPKGVEITHYNYVAHTLQMEDINDRSLDSPFHLRTDKWLCFLPLHHAMAQTFFVALALRRRTPVYMMPRFDYTKVLDYVQMFRVTRLVLVPAIIVMIAKDPRIKRGEWDLSSVWQIGSGAAPLGRELIEQLEKEWVGNNGKAEGEHRMTITQGYGMTELTCGVTFSPPSTPERMPKEPSPTYESYFNQKSSSVGVLLANCEAKLMNDEGEAEVPSGERGEVWIRGPTVMKGYWRNEEATKETVTEDGWLKTGDICYIDHMNEFHVVDRKKEIMKVNGHQVAPAELEALLLDHPAVLDAAVTSLLINPSNPPNNPNPINPTTNEERPSAWIVRRPGFEPPIEANEVVDFVAERVQDCKRITGGVVFVDGIPRNGVGKVLRRVLRGWGAEGARGGVGEREGKL